MMEGLPILTPAESMVTSRRQLNRPYRRWAERNMMADSITLVSIITLVDQFHLAARSARMLPMRSSSAPIRQHLQSAIQQTQENRPLFRLFPLEMDTTAYRIMHHPRP